LPWLRVVAAALFSYGGYDSAINFSEETDGSARNVGRSVISAPSLGVLFQVVPAFAVDIRYPLTIQPLAIVSEARIQ
jgi:amino acid transporter